MFFFPTGLAEKVAPHSRDLERSGGRGRPKAACSRLGGEG